MQTKDYMTMTLSECAKYDHELKLKERISLWRKFSNAIQLAGKSRKQRIRAKQNAN